MPLVAVEGDIDTHAELGALIALNNKTVFINNIPVIIKDVDHAAPDITGAGSNPRGQDPHDTPYPIEGSPSVFAYGIAVHREDDSRSCGAETFVVNQSTVFANGGTGYIAPDGAQVYNNPNGYRAVKQSYQYTNNGGEAATRDELSTYTGPGLTPNNNTGTPSFDSATVDSTSTVIVDKATPSIVCNIVIKTTADTYADPNTLAVDKTMKLSKYFKLGDFLLDGNWIPKSLPLTTDGGFRAEALALNGVSGHTTITGDEIICNLQALATDLLDPIMDRYNGGNRIPLNAAFRLPGRKRQEGQHGLGMAADLQQFPGFSHQMAFDISTWIVANLPFDQLLIEKIGVNPWIHLSYNRNGNRPSSSFPNKVGTLYPLTNQFTIGLKQPPY
jgi:hypothetical protein